MRLPSIATILLPLLVRLGDASPAPLPPLPLLLPLLPPSPTSSLLAPPLESATHLVGHVGNAPPPDILWTADPSPECAAINGGELQCCQATLAGDLPLVVFLAGVYGYELNANDVNGVGCDKNTITACPGVKVCCQVTALSPLVSLYCQDT